MDKQYDIVNRSWLNETQDVSWYPTELKGKTMLEVVSLGVSYSDLTYKFRQYKILRICASGDKLSKIDRKLQKFILEGGNFTTDVENDLNTSMGTITSTPKGFGATNTNINSLIVKLSDMESSIKRKFDDHESKVLNQYDNLVSRLNTIEKMMEGLKGYVDILEAVVEDRILKKNPAFEDFESFSELLELLKDVLYRGRLTTEMANIGGSSDQACVSNIMKRCLSNSVVKKYTLKGQGKEKDNFSTTLFYSCLLVAVKQGHPKTTDDMINKYLSNIFKNIK
ncbi:hypothetical protein ACFFRR_002832 [Megaselia abdita]